MKVTVHKISREEYYKNISHDYCPICRKRTLDWTMKPNDDNNPKYGCQIYGEICSNCGYEHYDDEDDD